MAPPFSPQEFTARLDKVRQALSARGLEALVVGDPANMNWLTGFDAWSFYVPQIILVTHDRPPIWIGRAMDAGAVRLTTYLPEESIRPYAEVLVQREDAHPAEEMAATLHDLGLKNARLGYESDCYFFSPKCLALLEIGLPEARFIDADRLVNWARVVKSPAEIALMRQAARIADAAQTRAREVIAPGLRQCDLMAEVLAAQVRGMPDFGGDQTALSPLILAGEAAATAHPLWSDAPFEVGQTVALELGGTRRRYNAGLARTLQLGAIPPLLRDTAAAVEEGLEAVLDTLRAGVTAGAAHGAWQAVLDRHGLEKESRIGYSIGVGYAPDWGEHTVSLRAGETVVLETGMCLHVMLGMWMADWGMELSETVLVTETGAECLTNFPRAVTAIR